MQEREWDGAAVLQRRRKKTINIRIWNGSIISPKCAGALGFNKSNAYLKSLLLCKLCEIFMVVYTRYCRTSHSALTHTHFIMHISISFRGASHPPSACAFLFSSACWRWCCVLVFGNNSRLMFFCFPITFSSLFLRFVCAHCLLATTTYVCDCECVRCTRLRSGARRIFLLFIDIIMYFIMECLKSHVPRITTYAHPQTHADTYTYTCRPTYICTCMCAWRWTALIRVRRSYLYHFFVA